MATHLATLPAMYRWWLVLPGPHPHRTPSERSRDGR
jgi:hypothetical protein